MGLIAIVQPLQDPVLIVKITNYPFKTYIFVENLYFY